MKENGCGFLMCGIIELNILNGVFIFVSILLAFPPEFLVYGDSGSGVATVGQ